MGGVYGLTFFRVYHYVGLLMNGSLSFCCVACSATAEVRTCLKVLTFIHKKVYEWPIFPRFSFMQMVSCGAAAGFDTNDLFTGKATSARCGLLRNSVKSSTKFVNLIDTNQK